MISISQLHRNLSRYNFRRDALSILRREFDYVASMRKITLFCVKIELLILSMKNIRFKTLRLELKL